MTYVENKRRNTKCQIMTEQAPQRAAATKANTRKRAAAAKTSTVTTAKTENAATAGDSTATTEKAMHTAKAAARSQKKNKIWPSQTSQID